MTPGGLVLEALPLSSTAPVEGAQAVSLTGAAGTFLLIVAPTRPIAIIRWGVIITTTTASAFPAWSLDFHPTAGTATGAVQGATTQINAQTGWNAGGQPAFYTDLAGGTITTTAALAAGKGAFHQINPQTKMPPTDSSTNPVPSPDTAFVPPGGMATIGMTILPGQEAAVRVVTAAGAGAGIPFIHYYPLDFVSSFSNYENVASGIPTSIQPSPSDVGIFSRFLS